MEATDLARAVAERAARDIGVKEKGQNRGKRIEQYQAAAGIKPGQPYCAAAICCWIKEAAKEMGVEYKNLLSPSAMRFLEYARKQGNQVYPFDIHPDDIPLIGIIDHGGGKGHAFLIVGMDEDSGALDTIDANSNAMGVRDGQGVVALTGRHYLKDLAGAVRIV